MNSPAALQVNCNVNPEPTSDVNWLQNTNSVVLSGVFSLTIKQYLTIAGIDANDKVLLNKYFTKSSVSSIDLSCNVNVTLETAN